MASNLINVPALTTLVRSFLAQYHGDAEATAAFAAQTLAKIKPGERLLSANANVFLAVAEWLRGRLTEAEHAITASATEWRETGQLTVAAWGYYSLVLIQRAQGRLGAFIPPSGLFRQWLEPRPGRGKQCPAVVKQHHAVAQQAPALPGMVCHNPGRAATWRQSIRAPRPMPAFPLSGPGSLDGPHGGQLSTRSSAPGSTRVQGPRRDSRCCAYGRVDRLR